MVTRRTLLKYTTATGGLLVPLSYQQRALGRRGDDSSHSTSDSTNYSSIDSTTKRGRFFGYKPFTQPLFVPKKLTPLKGDKRLYPEPGYYPREEGVGGYPSKPTGKRDDVCHGIAPEFGHCPQWNSFKSGFSRGNTHEQEFELITEEALHQFVPYGPQVPVFTYRDATMPVGSGSTPGPTIVTDHLAPVVLRNHNMLTSDRYPVNSTYHDVETSVHLHGTHSPAHADGYPNFYVLAGEARDYFYTNAGPHVTDPTTLCTPVCGGEYDTTWIPTTLWYHDHAMDITGFNVSHGLAGFYLVRSEREQELHDMGIIPEIGGYQDVALALTDQRFNADGTVFYDFLDHNGRLGDVFTVNGVVQPYLKVQRRKYRFRFLNASNARVYEIRLSNRQKMHIIGTDSWLLPRAIEVESFQLAPGQRHDVIIDFQDAPDEIFVENIMYQTDGRGAREVNPEKERDLLLKFKVKGRSSREPQCEEGTVIRGFAGIDPGGQWAPIRQDEIVGEPREFQFDRSNGAFTVNNRFFNPRRADATPSLGLGAERWIFDNKSGGWWHPIHTHLEGFQIQSINGRAPRRQRQFNSDVVMLEGGARAEVFIKFRTFTGPFAFHCHNIEHEDMRMMAAFDPIPDTGCASRVINTTAPMDGETRINSLVSGVEPECHDLEVEHRLYFEKAGDLDTVTERGVGFPECEFDNTLRGNRGRDE